MGKPTICIGKNKGADQLRSNWEADHRLGFRYTDITIPLLLIPKISSFNPASVTVQAGLCQTWSESKLLLFSRTCSNVSNLFTNGNNYLPWIFLMDSIVTLFDCWSRSRSAVFLLRVVTATRTFSNVRLKLCRFSI